MLSTPLLLAGLLHRVATVPATYWLLWCGSLALTIVLLVLMRARWGQARPLQKCAVLSLLVHLMLAFVAMTIRVVVGDGGGGGVGAPIRVRIVHDSGTESSTTMIAAQTEPEVAPPDLFEPPPAEPPPAAEPIIDAEKSADIATDAQPATARPVEEIADAAAPSPPEPEPAAPEMTVADDSEKVADARNDSPNPSMPAEPVAASTTPADAPLPVSPPGTHDAIGANTAPREVQSAPAAPASSTAASPAYSLRNAPGKMGLIQMQGGNEQTEAAVAAALAWLARSQSADGRWDANRFGAGREQTVLGHDRGGAGRNADNGVSALALLAFLGAGHSHQQGDYQDTVRRGLGFLIRTQADDGSLFGGATFYAQMYCHSMATFALAEAQAMTGDRRLEPAVVKAVGYSLRAQHAATGGWRYQPGDIGDTSQLGWQMMALASAQRAGIDVPTHTWSRVARFLKSVERGNDKGLASYRPDGPPSTSMTAEALYCRSLLEEFAGVRASEPAAAEAMSNLLAALPDSDRINLYYWYYGTLALHRRQETSDRSAAAWHSWNDALTVALVNSQVAIGPDAGSWNANTVWGGYGGRVYTTAMAAMCLEVYYRYAPAAAPGQWTATRPMTGEAPR